MMRWLSAVALILYLSLLITPHATAAHALHLSPLADSQLQAINPLAGQLSLTSYQDDDSDNSLLNITAFIPLFQYWPISCATTSVKLPIQKAAHPVRAPPLYFSA